jgi:hypothetical protein
MTLKTRKPRTKTYVAGKPTTMRMIMDLDRLDAGPRPPDRAHRQQRDRPAAG